MDARQNLDQPTGWRFTLSLLGGFLALAALAAVVVGLIAFVTGFFDRGRESAPIFLDLRTPPPPPDNAMTRPPQPYGPFPWPTSPGRGSWSRESSAGGAEEAAADSPASRPSAPVGMSVEDFRAATEGGGRIVLPNPQGECDLGGQDAARSSGALEKCFAAQAAR